MSTNYMNLFEAVREAAQETAETKFDHLTYDQLEIRTAGYFGDRIRGLINGAGMRCRLNYIVGSFTVNVFVRNVAFVIVKTTRPQNSSNELLMLSIRAILNLPGILVKFTGNGNGNFEILTYPN